MVVVSFWNHPIGKYIGKLKRKIKIWITYFLRQRDRENLWISHYMWTGQWAIETNGPVREFTQKAVMRLAEWRRQPWRHQVLADLITMAKYPLEDALSWEGGLQICRQKRKVRWNTSKIPSEIQVHLCGKQDLHSRWKKTEETHPWNQKNCRNILISESQRCVLAWKHSLSVDEGTIWTQWVLGITLTPLYLIHVEMSTSRQPGKIHLIPV